MGVHVSERCFIEVQRLQGVTVSETEAWTGSVAVATGMFVKKRAKIRGKLAGNWRHLQNKEEAGRRGAAAQRLSGPVAFTPSLLGVEGRCGGVLSLFGVVVVVKEGICRVVGRGRGVVGEG